MAQCRYSCEGAKVDVIGGAILENPEKVLARGCVFPGGRGEFVRICGVEYSGTHDENALGVSYGATR